MASFHKYKLLLFFLAIFLLGAVCGGTLVPVIVKKKVGNPYSVSVMSERILHTNLLDAENLTKEQREAINLLATKYVLEFTEQRELFIAQRRTVYDKFLIDISHILTPEQFESFSERSNKINLEHEAYNRKTRAAWSAEKQAHLKKKMAKAEGGFFDNADDDMAAFSDEGKANPKNKPVDIISRYIIDRYKNGWKTYTEYEDIKK